VRDGSVEGISDIRDETSDRDRQRIVIELKRDAMAKVVLNNLYKHTQLQSTFGIIMLAIVDGRQPRVLNGDASELLEHFIDHRRDVVIAPDASSSSFARRGARAHPRGPARSRSTTSTP
jgi:DNA gyrase subunit A